MARKQDDFCSLALISESCANQREIACKEIVSAEEAYYPVNFISEEVHAMIAAWEAGALTESKKIDQDNSFVAADSEAGYEPYRRMPTSALSDLPSPSRFHRSVKSGHRLKA